ncbi:hypothetical protein QEN19_001355 [Hanseniaspora menglaensis]
MSANNNSQKITDSKVHESDKSNVTNFNKFDQHYFNSYSHYSIHQEMLQDSVRTKSYLDAIVNNKDYFKDKVVMDIGTGSGILSMFISKYTDCKHIIAVDASPVIYMAEKIYKRNNLDENKISYVKMKVEDIETLPNGIEKVDIIVSEWMGYFLIYESMLNSVLYARDRWMDSTGSLFPDKCSMHVAAMRDIEYIDDNINFWDNVYGFDFTDFKPLVETEPIVDFYNSDSIISDTGDLIEFDLNTVTVEELTFERPFEVTIKQDNNSFNGLLTWFDIVFPQHDANKKQVKFSTGPFTQYTHWKQVGFYFDEEINCNYNDTLKGVLTCKPNKENVRDMDINIDYQFLPISDEAEEKSGVKSYTLH